MNAVRAFMLAARPSESVPGQRDPRAESSATCRHASCARRDPRRLRASQPSRLESLHAVADDRRERPAEPLLERQREAVLRLDDDCRWQAERRAFRRGAASFVCSAGCCAERGPNVPTSCVIDERHAHLEAVRHRHHVDVAEQLRSRDKPRSPSARPTAVDRFVAGGVEQPFLGRTSARTLRASCRHRASAGTGQRRRSPPA